MFESDFNGVLCPLITPFDDGKVDYERLERHVDWVIRQGIDGVVPCGTTGEFASLSDLEYEKVLGTTVDAVDGRVPVIAGACATSIPKTGLQIEKAAAVGADGALITLPYFQTANGTIGIERFFTAIADRSSLPLFLYNIPACTGQEITPETVATLSGHESIVGMKDSSGDLEYFQTVRRSTPTEFLLFQGYDSSLDAGLSAGANGGINALTNVIPGAHLDLAECHRSGDLEAARQIQAERITPLFEVCLEHGFAPVTKEALVSRGKLSSTEIRPPLVELTSAAREAVFTGVESALSEPETS